jgi:hypothetical protein
MPSFVDENTAELKVPGIIAPVYNYNLVGTQINHVFGKFIKNNYKTDKEFKPYTPFRIPVPGEGLPRVVNYLADQGGCAFWRLIWPGDELLSQNKAVIMSLYQMIQFGPFYAGIDCVQLQRQCTSHQRDFAKFLRSVSDKFKEQTGKGFKILYGLDDIVLKNGIPDYNPCKDAFVDPNIETNLREILSYSDEFVVPSKTMRDFYKKALNYDKISVIPNYAPKWWLDKGYNLHEKVEQYRKNKKKPRIVYAGSSTHFDYLNKTNQKDDFGHVVDAIIHDITKTKKYQWVFLGGFPVKLKQFIDDKQIEYHPWGPVNQYPDLLNNLKGQVMIAPLADNIFNRSKANIKLTEGGALGMPVVAQDLDCYEDAYFKFNTAEEMFKQIDNILLTERTYREASQKCRQYAEKFWLENHSDQWLKMFTTPYGDKSRMSIPEFVENNKEQFALTDD